MNTLNISKQIEAILFWKAEPVSYKDLSRMLDIDQEGLKAAVLELRNNLTGRGICIVETSEEITLGTSPDLAPFIEKLTKDELTKDLGKAGLETISIILYQGPISRSEIDYIRGVNSQFILRNLLIRGLVERIDNPKDARVFLYKASISLLSHLGVSRLADLPEFEKIRKEISDFKQSLNETETNE
jgi:segregation and condensation protein B